ncbi:hypothetical protein GCM10009634_71790 [Saccharothrix xinjiangensis]
MLPGRGSVSRLGSAREGRVRRIGVYGTTVTGTRVYRVRLEVTRRGPAGQCSCPWGSEGFFRKHCVATSPAWPARGDPAARPRSRSSSTGSTPKPPGRPPRTGAARRNRTSAEPEPEPPPTRPTRSPARLLSEAKRLFTRCDRDDDFHHHITTLRHTRRTQWALRRELGPVRPALTAREPASQVGEHCPGRPAAFGGLRVVLTSKTGLNSTKGRQRSADDLKWANLRCAPGRIRTCAPASGGRCDSPLRRALYQHKQ